MPDETITTVLEVLREVRMWDILEYFIYLITGVYIIIILYKIYSNILPGINDIKEDDNGI